MNGKHRHIYKVKWHESKDFCAGPFSDKTGEENKSQTAKHIKCQPKNCDNHRLQSKGDNGQFLG